MQRFILVLAALALIAAARAPAPEAIIRQAYDHIIATNAHPDASFLPPESLYSPRLRALVAAARKAAHGEAACGLDFVFWVDGQEEDIASADVSSLPAPDAATRIVVAKFVSTGQPHELHFTFRRLVGRWRLDDAESVIGTRWVWSRLLQCKA
ncbi:MAG TPA: hypothetical protein VHW60_12720 [Caulobacteraceae bacterium]|jgi:hypothetical protein|nr:hypothetical protein [Caulobacteraceae bacterium]